MKNKISTNIKTKKVKGGTLTTQTSKDGKTKFAKFEKKTKDSKIQAQAMVYEDAKQGCYCKSTSYSYSSSCYCGSKKEK